MPTFASRVGDDFDVKEGEGFAEAAAERFGNYLFVIGTLGITHNFCGLGLRGGLALSALATTYGYFN